MEQQNDALSFWKRPEGKTGKSILTVLGLGAAAAAWIYVVPFLLTAAWTTIQLGIAAAILYVMYLIATSERVKTLVFYGFQMISRSITSVFVDIDPIAILKSFARQMRKKRDEVDTSIARILGVQRTLDQTIQASDKEMRQALKLADVAQQNNDEDALNIQAEKAQRRQDNINDYTEMKKVVDDILTSLKRVRGRVDYHIQNSEDELQELIRKNEIASATRDATSSARSVLGDSDLLTVRNMAADSIKAKYSSALGELDGLIQMSQNLDSEIDLNRLALRAGGKAKLAELHKSLNQLDGGAPVKQLSAGSAPTFVKGQPADKWASRLQKPKNNSSN